MRKLWYVPLSGWDECGTQDPVICSSDPSSTVLLYLNNIGQYHVTLFKVFPTGHSESFQKNRCPGGRQDVNKVTWHLHT